MPGAGVGEGLFAGGERLVDLGALGVEAGEEVVGVGEPAFQSLQLEEQAGDVVVAGLRCVGDGEGAADGLAEQRELGGELGASSLRSVRGDVRRVWRGPG